MSDDPLLTKRKNREPIGWRVEYHLCLDCWSRIDEIAQPYFDRASEQLLEGDDAGVPLNCHKCDAVLRPVAARYGGDG